MKRKLQVAIAFAAAGLMVSLGATSATATENNIDPKADHSFVIHKYAQPAEPEKGQLAIGDGQEIPEFKGTPLEGVTFRISQVNTYSGQKLDPLNSASWDFINPFLQGLQDFNPNRTQAEFGEKFEQTTDSSGTAKFADFPIGFYYVEEIDAGANEV